MVTSRLPRSTGSLAIFSGLAEKHKCVNEGGGSGGVEVFLGGFFWKKKMNEHTS